MKKTILCLLITATLILPAAAEDIVIKNAHIIPVVGDNIPDGMILIRDGKIAAVGREISIPPEAEVIDAKGLFAYPGMIDPYTQLGLMEISNLAATADHNEIGDINPHIRAVEAVKPDSIHIPIARANGITAAQIIPGGAFISGMSGLIRLDGRTAADMIIESPLMLHVNLGAGGFFMGGSMTPPMRAEDKRKAFKDILEKARLYLERKQAAKKDPSLEWPEFDESLESLIPVVKGNVSLLLSVNAEKDIKGALKLIKELELKAVLFGCMEGWKVVEELKEAQIPVILGNILSSSGSFEDGYDAYYRNPAELHKAGIKIAFSSNRFLPPLSVNLPYQASKAAAFGLEKLEALRAVTINTAEILGVADIMGSLEPGKIANIVLADGDILDRRTNIKYVFIDGESVDLSNRYIEILEKYKR